MIINILSFFTSFTACYLNYKENKWGNFRSLKSSNDNGSIYQLKLLEMGITIDIGAIELQISSYLRIAMQSIKNIIL